MKKYVGFALGALAALFAVDAMLAWLGASVPGARQDPVVWGTYAAWAGAIFTPASLVASVAMWHRDQIRRDDEERDRLGVNVFLSAGESRSVLNNTSDRQIYAPAASGQAPRCIPAGGSMPFSLEVTSVMFLTARNELWEASTDAPSRRVSGRKADL